MLREAPRAIAEWVADDPLPELTLAEIDRRPSLHPVPVTGWRRLTGVVISVLGGVAIVVVAGWLLWQGVGYVDRTIEGVVGPADPADSAPLAPSPPNPVPEGSAPDATESIATEAPDATPILTWRIHEVMDGLPPGDVTALAVAPDGSVWAALRASTQVRAAVHAGGAWHRTSGGLGDVAGTPTWIAVDASGSVWMAVTVEEGNDRLVGFDGTGWITAEVPSLWGTVVAEGAGDELWVAGLDERMRPALFEWSEGQWHVQYGSATLDIAGAAEPSELATGALRHRIVLDGRGVAWFAGDATVARFDGRKLTLSEMGATWLALDARGDVWAPTPRGVRRHRSSAWSYFDARHGLPGTAPVVGSIRFGVDHTWAVFPGDASAVGYTTAGPGWEQSPEPPPGSGLEFVPPYAPRLTYTPAAVAVEGEPMWMLSEGRWSMVEGPNGNPLTGVLDVCRAPDGTFWVAAGGDLLSLRIDDR